MDSTSQKHPLRWLLFLWIGFLYIQGFLEGANGQGLTIGHVYIPLEVTLLAFVVIMAVHCVLHWSMLFKVVRMPWLLAYFFVQAFLAFMILSITEARFVVFGICLVLTIEAIHALKWTRLLILIVGIYLILYIAAIEPQNYLQNANAPDSFIKLIDSLTFVLFAVSCVLLYNQQARAHRHSQELLHELETTYSELNNAHTQLEATNIQLEDYAARVEDLTLLAERQRLARELHDTLSQGLVGLTMQLDIINGLLVRKRVDQAQNTVQQAMEQAHSMMEEARGVIDDLRNKTLDTIDFEAAVQAELRHFANFTTIQCKSDLEALPKIPSAYREQVLRFISESLTNVARHAQASQVWLRIMRQHNGYIVEICDNGIGFDFAKVATSSGHYGLLGLKERAQLIKGSLEVKSEAQAGTVLRFILPLRETEKCEGQSVIPPMNQMGMKETSAK